MAPFDTTCGNTWSYWSDSTTSSSATIIGPWDAWNNTTSDTTTSGNIVTYYRNASGIWTRWQQVPLYEVRRVSDIVRARPAARPRVVSKGDVEQARRKAEQLLFEHLTEEQKAMYRKLKRFHIIGSDGKRYEMDVSRRMHNVFELGPDGKRQKEFCIFQRGNTPLGDNHLAQKLLLEADANEFKRIANAMELWGSGRAG